MKYTFLALLASFTLYSCGEKDPSQLDETSEMRLEIKIEKSLSANGSEQTKKDVMIEIKLFEDKIQLDTGFTLTNHIGVTKNGQFIMSIGSEQFDLSEYYHGALIYSRTGYYGIELNDFTGEISKADITFQVDNKEYVSVISIPKTLQVLNDVTLLGSFDPLQDSLRLEWKEVSLPAVISSRKFVGYTGQTQSCVSNDILWNILATESVFKVPYTPIDEACAPSTGKLSEITTKIELVQFPINLLADYSKFEDVSVTFSQNYTWIQLNQY